MTLLGQADDPGSFRTHTGTCEAPLKSRLRRGTAAYVLTVILASCATPADPPDPSTRDPYPYTTPTPPAEPTPIDGTYVRIVTAEVLGGAGACRRCPPYRLQVGEDILGLEKGVFEVYHRGSGYLSIGHFTSDESTVTFFNDPNCPQDRGTYRVTPAVGGWSFVAVDDPCAYDNVREQFLTSLPWAKIDPPEGIYASADGAVLVLLNGRFSLERDGREISGTAMLADDRVTFEEPPCRQEFEWSDDQVALMLVAAPPVCEADWVTDLVEDRWVGVG